MKKHRLEKLFLSIVRTHADAENTEVLEEKNDIDNNMERILKLMTAEDTGTNSSETSSNRSELVSLISEFHQRYQALYGRYDHLIGKLKKHVPHRIGENGSSKFDYSSSDAESSDSGSEDSSNQGEKVDKAHENKAELGRRLHEAEKLLEEYRIETEQMRVELLKMKIENSSLKQQSVKTVQEVASLNEQLITKNKEKEEFRSENSTLSSKIQETEKALGDLRDEANNKLKLTTEVFSSEKAELLSMNENLKHRLEVAEHQAVELLQQLETADEEKNSLKSENLRLSSQVQEADRTIRDLKINLGHLQDEVSNLLSIEDDLNQQLKVKDENINALASEHSDVIRKVQQAEGNIEMLLRKIEDSDSLNSKLSVDYDNLTMELEAKNKEVYDVKMISEMEQKEKHLLIEENVALSSKIEQNEKTMNDFICDRKQLESDVSQLRTKIIDMDRQLQEADLQLLDMTRALRATEEEKHVLTSEISGVMCKLQEAQIYVKKLEDELQHFSDENPILQPSKTRLLEAEKKLDDFTIEIEHLRYDNSLLQIKTTDLSQELESLNLQSKELTTKLKITEEEKRTLISEVSSTTSKLQKEEIRKMELENEIELLREEISVQRQDQIKLQQMEKIIEDFRSETEHLRTDNSQMKDKINDLSLQLEENDIQLAELNKAVVSAEEEKSILASRVSSSGSLLEQGKDNAKTLENNLEQLRDENSMLRKNQEDLKNQNSDLGRRLEEAQVEVLTLQQKLEEVPKEEVPKEASGSILATIIKENNLQMDLDMLHSKKRELEEQLKIVTDRLSENQILTKGIEDELTSKNLDQGAVLKDQENSFSELPTNYKKVEDKFQDSCKKLELAERLIVEIVVKEETIKILEAIVEEQKEGLNELEGSKKECQEKLKLSELEKADVEKEASKLLGQVHTLEVQLVLSNQKLKITETEAKATIETCKKMAEELRDERKELEDQIMTLSKKLGRSEYELKKMKETTRLGMARLTDKLNELAELFEEKHGHILKRLSESMQELNLVKTWFFKQLNEKQELKNAKDELSVRLNQTEGFLAMLKDEAGIQGAKMAEKEKQVAELMRTVVESENKLKQLEKKVKEEEEEVLAKDEEKREAIRQLCLLIEYHRENCNQLHKYITQATKRSGQ